MGPPTLLSLRSGTRNYALFNGPRLAFGFSTATVAPRKILVFISIITSSHRSWLSRFRCTLKYTCEKLSANTSSLFLASSASDEPSGLVASSIQCVSPILFSLNGTIELRLSFFLSFFHHKKISFSAAQMQPPETTVSVRLFLLAIDYLEYLRCIR
jgi:hypothetical protein